LIIDVGGAAWESFFRTCPSGENKVFLSCEKGDPVPTPVNGDTNLRPGLYTWEPQRFSWGHQTLFPGDGNIPRDEGIKAFREGDYQAAADSFKRAVEGNQNDPEVLIFYNNARARQNGNPYTLAVVVPVDSRSRSAQEMLRGVAQAQDAFNLSGGLDGQLLEIVIANDGNEPELATQVAEQIISDESVLGVIGHNSSSASEAGLAVYEDAGLPMISPTSTSTDLAGEVFFRTVPSDAAAAEKLAQYARDEMDISNVVIFYNPESSFSNSLQAAFKARFEELGGDSISKDMTDPQLDAGIEVSTAASEDQAEAILLFPNTDYTSVAIELAKANSKLQNRKMELLGGDSLYSIDTLTAGGESAEDLILPVAWFSGAERFEDFSRASEQQWGGTVSWRTATSFDAAQAFIQAFSENATRATLLEGLKEVSLSTDETSGQAFQFTSEGERQSDPVLVRVVRGKNTVPGSDFGFELLPD
jgi:branched-chain amino acid transport system substrate-binding protein